MKKLILIISLSISLFACEKDVYQDERLIFLLEEVKMELSDRGVEFNSNSFNLIIDPNLFDNGAHGYSKGNTISIDERTFLMNINEGDYHQLETLLLHEIGHNVFGLGHHETQYGIDDNGRFIAMSSVSWWQIEEGEMSDMYDQFVESL